MKSIFRKLSANESLIMACLQVYRGLLSLVTFLRVHLNSKGLGNCVQYFFHKMGGFSIRFSSCGILHHMGNAWVFSSISHSMRRGRKTHQMGKAWETGSWENPTKLIICGEPGKLVLILFPEYGCFSPIRFTSYDILYDMWNTWVSSSIFQSMRKCSEIHRIGRAWEIGTHFPPNIWTHFFHQIPILRYTLPHGETHGFSHQFLIARKNAAKSTQWALRLLFRSMFVSTCSKIWWFLKRVNRKNR